MVAGTSGAPRPGEQHDRAADPGEHQHGVEDEVGQRLRHRAWPPRATMRSKSWAA